MENDVMVRNDFAQDEIYMLQALELARQAAQMGEVPVGAVVVRDGKVIGAAGNRRECDHRATAHAELLAIEQACERIGSWRLSDCTLYVTLEPCPMCAGAIVNARVGRVVFGCKDARAGAMGSVLNLPSYPLNHRPQCECGVCETECRTVLQEFFAARRRKNESLRCSDRTKGT
jgi:tRNA(adenine34) deaminase